VTTADAWVDDPTHPEYNRHVRIPDPNNPPAWFEKQKMRHGDFAYRWLSKCRHNSDPPVAGDGSAIFFHIRPRRHPPTAGCTTMAEDDLVRVIKWLRRQPQAVLRAAPFGRVQDEVAGVEFARAAGCARGAVRCRERHAFARPRF
jgi:L,D-peptidoglycan transpeptidase YkuD (ErfK/YbiS/YcfS/YnhG family)